MARTIKLSDVIPSRFAHLTPANEENIERIRTDLVDGCKMLLNEPHAFREGDKWEMLAGHDRIEAARRAGWTEVQVRDFSGAVNTDDAILAHFCRENLLRKEISKAAIAGEWLRKHPEWSDGKLADESGCTAAYVGQVRAELGIDNPKLVSGSREGRDGKTREYKPRQVRQGVPSNRGIPHPTKTTEVKHESAEDMAEALLSKAAPETKGSAGTDTTTPDVVPVGESPAPGQGVDAAGAGGSDAAESMADRTAPEGIAPSLNQQGGEHPADVAVLLGFTHRQLTAAELTALSDDDERRLTLLGRWCQQIVARRRSLIAQGAAA